MSWRSRYAVVVRGHNVTDSPTASGYVEAVIPALYITPKRVPVGSSATYIGDIEKAPRLRRWSIEVKAWPFKKVATGAGDADADYGHIAEQLDFVLTRRYVYLYRVFASGTAPANGAVPRAAIHTATVDGANTFWNYSSSTDDGYPYSPAGILPLAVECLEGLDPQPLSGGNVDLTFTLTGRSTITMVT